MKKNNSSFLVITTIILSLVWPQASFACLSKVMSLTKGEQTKKGIVYTFKDNFSTEYTVTDNDGYFSNALLYKTYVAKVGQGNIDHECVTVKSARPKKCEKLPESSQKELFAQYRKAYLENLKRAIEYLKGEIAASEALIKAADKIGPTADASSLKAQLPMFRDALSTFEKHYKSELTSKGDYWDQLLSMRNYLSNYALNFSYETKLDPDTNGISGKAQLAFHTSKLLENYARANKRNPALLSVLGNFDDIDVTKPEPLPTRGLGGCGSKVSDENNIALGVYKASESSSTLNLLNPKGGDAAQ